MKAFITGIAGFAGSHLVDRLLRDGTEVSGLLQTDGPTANLSRSKDHLRLESGDIRDREGLTSLLKSIRPDVIYHLAALASARQASGAPEEAFAANFIGTWSLCRAAVDSGIDPEVFVISTGEIYGDQEGPIKESAPLRPANSYAISKAAADLAALQHHLEFGLRAIRLRPFNHTGSRQAPIYVCSDFAQQIAKIESGQSPPVLKVGNLEVIRDFLSVEDVVEGYRLAPGRLQPGEPYNIASGQGRKIRELLDILVGLSKVPIQVRTETARLRTGEARGLVGDASRFRDATGWKPAHPLEEALATLLEEWRSRISSSSPAG